MRQFDYYGTWDDALAILQSLLDRDDIRLVHDSGIWERPEVQYYHSLTGELIELLQQRPFLYIYGAFSQFPPGFVLRDSGPDAGTYRLAINSGGPGLELGLPVCRKTQETIELGSRFLAYPATFLNPETQVWQQPTDELRSAFADLRARMKRCLRRTPVHHKVLFIGPRALQLLDQGQAQIIDRGIRS